MTLSVALTKNSRIIYDFYKVDTKDFRNTKFGWNFNSKAKVSYCTVRHYVLKPKVSIAVLAHKTQESLPSVAQLKETRRGRNDESS